MFWKLYLVMWILLTFTTLARDFSEQGVVGFSAILNFVLGIVGAVGLCGLICNRKFFTVRFWKTFLILQLGFILFATMMVVLIPADSSKSILNLYSLLFILMVGPYFYGLYLYSYRRLDLWETTNNQIRSDG